MKVVSFLLLLGLPAWADSLRPVYSSTNVVRPIYTGTNVTPVYSGLRVSVASLVAPTFVSSFSNSTTGSSCTVAAVNCSGGNMLVIKGNFRNSTGRALSTVTFGGNGCASQFVTNFISSSFKIFTYTTNTSATADVVVTLSGTASLQLNVICEVWSGVGSVGNGDGYFNVAAVTSASCLPPGGVSSDVISECLGSTTASGIVQTDTSHVTGFLTNAGNGGANLFSGWTNGTAAAVVGAASGAGTILSQTAVILHGQ